MKKRISMGVLDTDKTEEARVIDTIRSGFLSAGPAIESFENKIAALHGKKYGIFVNSGQSALEVALVLAKECLGLYNRPLRVLIPSTTYAATLWAVLNTGNIPVFCDINRDTLCIDYSCAKDKVFDIVLPVDLCGYAAGSNISGSYQIEDACEAVGNSFANYGDIICSSFYVSHLITTGSGGMLCLNDDYLVEYARSYISHGRKFGGDYTKYENVWVDRFLFDKVGISARGNALDAAFGLAQLEKLDRIIQGRRKNAEYFYNLWMDSDIKDKVWFPDIDYISKCVFQFFPVVLDNLINRERVLKFLFAKGIDSRVLLSLTNQPIFRKLYGNIENDYPVSKFINSQGFILGCHQQLNTSDMKYIFETLTQAIRDQYNDS